MALAVPYALDLADRLVEPAAAVPRGEYICLECRGRVHFKPGQVKRPHFFHAPGTSCSGESVSHLAAKRRLLEALPDCRSVEVVMPCRRHGCAETRGATWALPEFDDVRDEVAYGEYRLDVALLRRGEVVAAIEVFQSHRVGAAKAAGLRVPWVEVRAEDVLGDARTLCPLVEEVVGEAQLSALERQIRLTGWESFASFHLVTAWHDLVFEARAAQQSAVSPWRCDACEAEWERERLRRGTYERRAAEETERQRLAEEVRLVQLREAQVLAERNRELQRELERDRRELERRRLSDQRARFGPRLRSPLSDHALSLIETHGEDVKFALRYLKPHMRDFGALADRALLIKFCPHCGGRIVCVDTARYIGKLAPFGRLLAYWKKPGAARGYVFNVCQHAGCGQWQKAKDLDAGPCVSLDGTSFVEVLTAFGLLARRPS